MQGAEYGVLPDLISRDLLRLVDYMAIEFHPYVNANKSTIKASSSPPSSARDEDYYARMYDNFAAYNEYLMDNQTQELLNAIRRSNVTLLEWD